MDKNKLKCWVLAGVTGVVAFNLGRHWEAIIKMIRPPIEPRPNAAELTTSEEVIFVG
jgi:hypothetical protein